jgi:hypothetical protein
MSMDQQLAAHFGNGITKQASAEELQKQATVELFHKMASNAKVDLDTLSVAEIENLWTGTIGKLAAEGKLDEAIKKHAEFPPAKKDGDEDDKKKKDDEEKKAAAEAEVLQKRAMAEKTAEAEMFGRTMAHAYVAELREIAKEAAQKTAGEMPEAFKKHLEGKKGGDDKPEEKKDKEKDEEKKAAIAKIASAMPNLDELAHGHAIDLAKQAGLNVEEAGQKVAAVRILGLAKPENTKIASAQNTDHAIHIRALELLETAGYTVNWNKA